jgi:NitT/TauT family transport system permease protein
VLNSRETRLSAIRRRPRVRSLWVLCTTIARGISPVLLMLLKIGCYGAALWAVWVGGIRFLHLPPYLVPPPASVLASLEKLPRFYLRHAIVTMQEAGGGLMIGFAGGFVCGLLLRYGGPVGRALNPLILASQVFPKEALAPILLVFLGFGILPKVVVAALISFFPVAINTFRGLQATPVAHEQLMRVLGANAWERFWRCHLPFSASHILAALNVCATLSIIGAVVGEFVGSSAGLGHVIRAANADLGTDRVYAALLLLGIIGSLFYGATLLIEYIFFRRFTGWK